MISFHFRLVAPRTALIDFPGTHTHTHTPRLYRRIRTHRVSIYFGTSSSSSLSSRNPPTHTYFDAGAAPFTSPLGKYILRPKSVDGQTAIDSTLSVEEKKGYVISPSALLSSLFFYYYTVCMYIYIPSEYGIYLSLFSLLLLLLSLALTHSLLRVW